MDGLMSGWMDKWMGGCVGRQTRMMDKCLTIQMKEIAFLFFVDELNADLANITTTAFLR